MVKSLIFLENQKNTLLLSSLGAYLFRNNNDKEQKIILQKNISITPANIINTVQLAAHFQYAIRIKILMKEWKIMKPKKIIMKIHMWI